MFLKTLDTLGHPLEIESSEVEPGAELHVVRRYTYEWSLPRLSVTMCMCVCVCWQDSGAVGGDCVRSVVTAPLYPHLMHRANPPNTIIISCTVYGVHK